MSFIESLYRSGRIIGQAKNYTNRVRKSSSSSDSRSFLSHGTGKPSGHTHLCTIGLVNNFQTPMFMAVTFDAALYPTKSVQMGIGDNPITALIIGYVEDTNLTATNLITTQIQPISSGKKEHVLMLYDPTSITWYVDGTNVGTTASFANTLTNFGYYESKGEIMSGGIGTGQIEAINSYHHLIGVGDLTDDEAYRIYKEMVVLR